MLHIIKIYILILHRQILAITLRNRKRKKNTRKRHWKANISQIITCYLYRVLWFNRLSNANSQQKCRKSLVNAVTWSKYVWQAKIRGFTYAENHMLDLTREGQAIH